MGFLDWIAESERGKYRALGSKNKHAAPLGKSYSFDIINFRGEYVTIEIPRTDGYNYTAVKAWIGKQGGYVVRVVDRLESNGMRRVMEAHTRDGRYSHRAIFFWDDEPLLDVFARLAEHFSLHP